MKVKLRVKPDQDPLATGSYAALTCVEGAAVEFGELIDIVKRIFKTGHHTILQHTYFTFEIYGISVGDVYFGLHLVSQFYNTSQQSGRLSLGMYSQLQIIEAIMDYIQLCWPRMSTKNLWSIRNYLQLCFDFYHQNIDEAVQVAKRFAEEERPYLRKKVAGIRIAKAAQEGLRFLIPLASPTNLVYTINLSALIALQRTAQSNPMRMVTQMMVDEVVRRYPELAPLFTLERVEDQSGFFNPYQIDKVQLVTEPGFELISARGLETVVVPEPEDLFPSDLTPFLPQCMSNRFVRIFTKIQVSGALMGDEWRHRLVDRTLPQFTGGMYFHPIAVELGLEQEFRLIAETWLDLAQKLPLHLTQILAPYGMVIEYFTEANFNTIAHRESIRSCWSASVEFNGISVALRKAIEQAGYFEKNPDLDQIFAPPCWKDECPQGPGYCGRDLDSRDNPEKFFAKRRV